MFNITLDEFLAWTNLVACEILISFLAVGLLLIGTLLIAFDYLFSGILCLIFAVFFAFVFIGIVRCYLKGDFD